MTLQDRVIDWVNNRSEFLCRSCSDNCCSCSKHAIKISSKDLEPFIEHGVPVISLERLSDRARYLFLEDQEKNEEIRLKDGSKLPDPSVVQCKKSLVSSGCYEIYSSGSCPLYQDGKCSVYFDNRRPRLCKTYPVFVNDTLKIATFRHSCKPFNTAHFQREFQANFPDLTIVNSLIFGYRVSQEQLRRAKR